MFEIFVVECMFYMLYKLVVREIVSIVKVKWFLMLVLNYIFWEIVLIGVCIWVYYCSFYCGIF